MRPYAIAAVLILLVPFAATCDRSDSSGDPTSSADTGLTPNSDARVLVLGFDGLDMDVIEPMIEKGELPAFARAMKEGASGKLRSITPMLSPIIWTTIATSKGPMEHGVQDFVVEDPETGRILPVSSFERRAEAVWDILGVHGVTNGVVGYLASWPAEQVKNGFMVSDRLKLLGYEYGRREDEHRAEKVAPPELLDEIEPMVRKVDDVTYEEMSKFLNVTEEEYRKAYTRAPQPGNKIGNFRLYYAAADTYRKVGRHLWRTKQPRFQVTYFEFFDASCHLFMPFAPPRMSHISEADFEKYKGVVAEVCRYSDRTLAEAMEDADENTTIIVVSDHGFRSGARRPKKGSEFHDRDAVRWHRQFGVFMAWGNGVRAGARVGGANVFDITPTILGLMGLPKAEDMRGRFLSEAFTVVPPETTIATYERGRRDRQIKVLRGEDIGDDILLKQLEALGYMGGERTANTHMNLASFLLSEGKPEEALKELKVAHDKEPGDPRIMMTMGEVYMLLQDMENARKWFEAAVRQDPDLTPARLKLSGLLKAEGRPKEAIEHAREAVKRDPEEPMAHFQLGVLLLDSRSLAEGELEIQKALDLEPDFPQARNQYGILLLGKGRLKEAEAQFRASIEFEPGFVRAWNNLGVTLLRRAAQATKDPQEREETYDRAIETFTAIIERFPDYPGIHKTYYNRALIYKFRRQMDNAVRDARKALEINPDYEEPKVLLSLIGASPGPKDDKPK